MKAIVVFKSGTELEVELPFTAPEAGERIEIGCHRPLNERRYFIGRCHGGKDDTNIAHCSWTIGGENRDGVPVFREVEASEGQVAQ